MLYHIKHFLGKSLGSYLSALPCQMAWWSSNIKLCFSDLCDVPRVAIQVIWKDLNMLGIKVSGLPWWLRQWRTCLQCWRPGFDPWVRKIPWRREWLLSPLFLPRESHEQRSLLGFSPWNHKELDITGWLTHIKVITSVHLLILAVWEMGPGLLVLTLGISSQSWREGRLGEGWELLSCRYS